MISRQQKALLHLYAAAAALDRVTYENVLRDAGGYVSAADPAFTQAAFERAMASLEQHLAERLAAGQVPPPRSRWIRAPGYWRGRLPSAGAITTRQKHEVNRLTVELLPLLPERCRSLDYLVGIVTKATGSAVWPRELSAAEAGALIDALSDRLAYARRRMRRQEAAA
jgi:hypothetical protein